jgi:hypothetical protein
MSKTLATGTQFAIGSAFGATQTFTSASNAAETVLSFASDPSLATGDVVHILTSGWGRLVNRVLRVKSVSGSGPYLVTLENVNTTDTNKFPSGSGGGTLREVSTWTAITQVADVASSGGEQNFADSSDMDDADDKQIPSNRSAESMTLTVHHDPALPWVAVVDAAEGVVTPFRIVYPSSARMLAGAYFTRKRTASITRNETIKSTIDLAYAAQPIEYAT